MLQTEHVLAKNRLRCSREQTSQDFHEMGYRPQPSRRGSICTSSTAQEPQYLHPREWLGHTVVRLHLHGGSSRHRPGARESALRKELSWPITGKLEFLTFKLDLIHVNYRRRSREFTYKQHYTYSGVHM